MKTDKLKKMLEEIVGLGLDDNFSGIVLRQLIFKHFEFVEEGRVRDLIKGLVGAQFIIKLENNQFRFGAVTYSTFGINKEKIKEERETEEAKKILGAKVEVD